MAQRLRRVVLATCIALGIAGALPLARAADAPGPPAWRQLSPEHQRVLEPLQESWDSLTVARKKKWIEVAKRYPKLSPQEQGRLRVRMKDWAALSPEQRREARDAYRQFDNLTPEQKQLMQQKWAEYRQLQEEKRREGTTIDGGAGPAEAPAKN